MASKKASAGMTAPTSRPAIGWLLPVYELFLAEAHLCAQRPKDALSVSDGALSEIERRGDRARLSLALSTKGHVLGAARGFA